VVISSCNFAPALVSGRSVRGSPRDGLIATVPLWNRWWLPIVETRAGCYACDRSARSRSRRYDFKDWFDERTGCELDRVVFANRTSYEMPSPLCGRQRTSDDSTVGGEAMSILRQQSDSGDMTGLEQLRALLRMGLQPNIGATLQFSGVEFEDGFAAFEGTPGEHVYNPIGTVHGGYAATLLDSALGCAVHTKLAKGQSYTTLELKVAYHRPMTKDTGKVRAEGRIVSIGRRAAFAEARLTDASGQLYASATSTLLVITP